MLRSGLPGIEAVYLPLPRLLIVTLVRVSVVEFTSSTKYLSVTLLRLFVAEKVQFTVTGLPARTITAPSLVWAADCAMTTGFGTGRLTACGPPGVGPVSGEASQFRGSLDGQVTLRSAERRVGKECRTRC